MRKTTTHDGGYGDDVHSHDDHDDGDDNDNDAGDGAGDAGDDDHDEVTMMMMKTTMMMTMSVRRLVEKSMRKSMTHDGGYGDDVHSHDDHTFLHTARRCVIISVVLNFKLDEFLGVTTTPTTTATTNICVFPPAASSP